MSTPHPFRLLLLLAAAGLWACSDDDSNGPSGDDDELPEFPAGDSQLDPGLRATVADILADVGAASGVASDPEAAGVVGAIGAAFIGEGKVTGVTASSATLRTPPGARVVDGTWGVFGAAVALYPNEGSAIQAYYTGVIALNGNQVAIGIKRADTEQEIVNANAEFPHPKAVGLFFQGRQSGWGALDGYMQVIPKSSEGGCAGVAVTGIVCSVGIASAGLEILASAPLPFSGNQASGTRMFELGYADYRGYFLEVYCDQVDFC